VDEDERDKAFLEKQVDKVRLNNKKWKDNLSKATDEYDQLYNIA
jgi:hypothetical protein